MHGQGTLAGAVGNDRDESAQQSGRGVVGMSLEGSGFLQGDGVIELFMCHCGCDGEAGDRGGGRRAEPAAYGDIGIEDQRSGEGARPQNFGDNVIAFEGRERAEAVDCELPAWLECDAQMPVEGEANAIAPAKRMLSAMTPTIVTRRTDKDEEELFLVLGASGGPTIITTVLQVFLNSVVFGRNLREAVDAPRFHHQHLPDEIAVEKFALSRETAERLEKMGYKLREREYIGSASAIRVLSEGWFAGWADWAGAGAGTGW